MSKISLVSTAALASILSFSPIQGEDSSRTLTHGGEELHELPGHPGIFYTLKEVPCPDGAGDSTGTGGGGHHHSKHDPRHPLPTPAQEKLAKSLMGIQGHIYKRPIPGDANNAEFGKPYKGKVYFMRLGIPEEGVGVDPVKDIVNTNVAGEDGKRGKGSLVRKAQEAIDAKNAHSRSSHKSKNHGLVPPGGLGTTSRPNLVRSEPTEGGRRQFSVGAPNVAQIGVTGEDAPNIDTSETGPAIPPPPPPPPPVGRSR